MAKPNFDYNEVADRVRGFNEQYPDGRIETHYEVLDLGGKPHIAVTAQVWKEQDVKKEDGGGAQYRRPDSTGLSWLEVPGKTNFTRGSEIENAETSAVGRALAFIGFYAKGESLASTSEINAKKGSSSPPVKDVSEFAVPADEAEKAVVGKSGLTDSQRKKLFGALKGAGVTGDQRKAFVWLTVQKHSVKDMTSADLDAVLAVLEGDKSEHPEVWENVELVSGE